MMTFHRFQKMCFVAIIAIMLVSCGGGGSNPIASVCTTERATLEQSIHSNLDSFTTDTDFTLLIESDDDRQFEHNTGSSNAKTLYRSASTSKFVTAVIILSLVKSGVLSLTDQPQDYIAGWPTTGNLSSINLSHLLSFSSGLSDEVLCVNLPGADPATCVNTILTANLANTESGGDDFFYGSSHMQVAGLMAITALTGATTWQDVFTDFRNSTGLFGTSAYDLPSLTNPRLAGGMHWSADEYLIFLRSIYKKTILTPALITQMTSDQISGSTISNSPAFTGTAEDWHYGFGNWIECHSPTFNCTQVTRISSPGAFGAYPFIDYVNNYFGIVAREGALGTFTNGYDVFLSVSGQLEQWAAKTCT